MNGAVQVLDNRIMLDNKSVLEDERALVLRAQAEPEAFATLYEMYFPRVYSYVLYRIEDPDTAADITALTFERAYTKLASYRPDRAAFSTWLFTIATNAIRNQRRRKWLPISLSGEHRDPRPSPERTVEKQQTIDALLAAVSELPEREREILALKFGARLSNREIAELKGLSESNVGVIVYRAVNKLRAELDEEIGR